MPTTQSKFWIFTKPNYNEADVAFIKAHVPETAKYITFGYEIAPTTNMHHLQGYVEWRVRKNLAEVRNLLPGAHVAIRRGTAEQARDYCQKDGVFEEEGEMFDNQGQGHRSDIDDFKCWVTKYHLDHGCKPVECEYSVQFPGLFLRYRANLKSLVDFICPDPVLEDGALKDWQGDVWTIIQSEPDDRKIIFIVDKQGGIGKTWLQRYLLSHIPARAQVLSMAKRDDVAHAVDESKDVFLFNIPRGGMEFLNYTVLEQIKDKMVFSPKYNSRTKIFAKNTHVFVFCNEEPNYGKMSRDRYHVVNLEEQNGVIVNTNDN